MLAAAGYLQQDIAGITVDAVVGRQVSAALTVLQTREQAGTLGSVVIVHVGNNGPFTPQQFDDMMRLAGSERRVVVVNDKVPRPWQDSNNAVLAAGVKRYPNAVLLDWYQASAANPNLFWSDGVHLRPEGAQLYAHLLAALITST
jgi:lysophospholipase L1-like esterase